MKKVFLVLALVLAMAIGATAQDPVKGLTGAGFKAGLVMAKASGDNIDEIESYFDAETKYLMGFAAGGFIEYSFSQSFAIQPELLYNMKGVKFENDSAKAEMALTYMQIPILLKFNIPTQGKFRPYIFAGPAIGILLSAEATVEGTTSDDVDGEDIKDDFKSTDFGAVLGLGAEIPMGTKGALTFDIRYDMGLSNVQEDIVEGTETIEGDAKTSSIALMVGFSFL